jgi:hypothetical protein
LGASLSRTLRISIVDVLRRGASVNAENIYIFRRGQVPPWKTLRNSVAPRLGVRNPDPGVLP